MALARDPPGYAFALAGLDLFPIRKRRAKNVDGRRESSGRLARKRDHACIANALRNRGQQIRLPVEPAHDQIPCLRLDRELVALEIGANILDSRGRFVTNIHGRHPPAAFRKPPGMPPGTAGQVKRRSRRQLFQNGCQPRIGGPALVLPAYHEDYVLRFPAFLLLPALVIASPHPSQTPLSILHDVSVVDVAAGRILPHRDIFLRGERIADIRPAATRIARERYVIPGLWDMHVHLWNDDPQTGLYIANGVTSVRDMGSDLKRIRTLEARIARGELTGPHIYAAGAVVSSTPAEPGLRMPVNIVRTPDEARHIFDLYYDERVDVIHIRDLDARSFEALAERSRHDGIPFAGDLPDSVSAADAALDRMVSMEHLFGIGLACSSKQQELRARAGANDVEIMDSYDPSTAASLWDLFRRYGVRQTPMLTWWNRRACLNGAGDGIAYVAESTRSTWKPPQPETDQAHYDFAMKLTREMAQAGVPILAGTDTGEPWTAPGFELHRELELLQSAGLTPAQALRAATLEPAKLMRREDQGEVTKGDIADLVVLTANPLADIGNTRAIEEVVVRGKTILQHR